MVALKDQPFDEQRKRVLAIWPACFMTGDVSEYENASLDVRDQLACATMLTGWALLCHLEEVPTNFGVAMAQLLSLTGCPSSLPDEISVYCKEQGYLSD